MMKRTFLLASLALTALTAAAQPDTPVTRYLRENPRRAAFNTHSYEFLPLRDTPAPKGYKPFYISHYGRHGSRSEWGGSSYTLVRDVLAKAKEQDLLTPAGDSLMKEAAVIYELYNGMDGRLTPRGVREHAALAERMYYRYPEVFQDGSKHIRAVSSTTPRCIVSMNGFTARLASIQPDLDFDLDTGEKYFTYIAQGENNTIVQRTNRVLAEHRKKMDLDTVTVLRNLFTDPAAGRKFIPDINTFQGAIYSVAKVAEAFDIDDNLFRYLPFGNVVQYHEHNFLSAYLNQCNSELNGAIRLPLNKPLADVLVQQADDVIAGTRKNAADLTFGHDWPFLGLVCYLGLEGVSEKLSIEDAAANWLPAWYCPFAANLQMVFYRSKKSDRILVKFLHNERETRIPAIQAVQGPYYDWNDVKAYLVQRIPSAKIVAHRGYWKDNAENSIASLREAQHFGCWGSEFDLHLTADDVVVVNHDQVIGGLDIQKSTFAEIREKTLANGEHVPTLAEYMAQASHSRECMPVLELKPQGSPEREDILIQKCLQALQPAPVRNVPPEFAAYMRRPEPTKVVFISFSRHICQELARLAPGYTVQYLGGDLDPATLHAEGINGIDYHYSVFYKHPEWVRQAHDLGMSVNVWTVDNADDLRKMRDLGVDQITTNDPALTQQILWEICR